MYRALPMSARKMSKEKCERDAVAFHIVVNCIKHNIQTKPSPYDLGIKRVYIFLTSIFTGIMWTDSMPNVFIVIVIVWVNAIWHVSTYYKPRHRFVSFLPSLTEPNRYCSPSHAIIKIQNIEHIQICKHTPAMLVTIGGDTSTWYGTFCCAY